MLNKRHVNVLAVAVYERQVLCLFSYNVIENSIIYIHEQYPTKQRSERYLYEKEVPCKYLHLILYMKFKKYITIYIPEQNPIRISTSVKFTQK